MTEQSIVLQRETWSLLLDMTVSRTVDELGLNHVHYDASYIKKTVRKFLPPVPFEPVQHSLLDLHNAYVQVMNLEKNEMETPPQGYFPVVGDRCCFRSRFSNKHSKPSVPGGGWFVWPTSSLPYSNDSLMDLSKNGIVEIAKEESSVGVYKVINSISFIDFPRRFYLESFDYVMDEIESTYSGSWDFESRESNDGAVSQHEPNYHVYRCIGDVMGYHEGADIHFVKIADVWYSILVDKWEDLSPQDNSSEVHFSRVPDEYAVENELSQAHFREIRFSR
mmetsp:Transcript_28415/g.41890  ORF Transcript_28415/g.41890 Transcript_28415/m.41890 type:complete len:278 (-) Transcript_28415:17-850(-)|eukprot:CAMPEP_0194071168 /NCGR_PEP_ID=MMETSP0009_2-20130614/88565_1 /TAXON_ID=210454 /ORGANISM="Grammatophora oceanica, Strain CCMP 410" /LENGTH=277 /DNA_ID=CAMNT_0038724477 /DNA_START=10 /DNA_END=843 /DNA_ORIENTATION=-